MLWGSSCLFIVSITMSILTRVRGLWTSFKTISLLIFIYPGLKTGSFFGGVCFGVLLVGLGIGPGVLATSVKEAFSFPLPVGGF